VRIALVDNQWTGDKTAANTKGKVSPLARKFFDALCAATNKANNMRSDMFGHRATTIVEWRDECVRRGLIDVSDKKAGHSARTLFAKYKRDLIAANLVVCNETMAWSLLNRNMKFFR
jgi:hypothetical protein